jgi:hypothetical protein
LGIDIPNMIAATLTMPINGTSGRAAVATISLFHATSRNG